MAQALLADKNFPEKLLPRLQNLAPLAFEAAVDRSEGGPLQVPARLSPTHRAPCPGTLGTW